MRLVSLRQANGSYVTESLVQIYTTVLVFCTRYIRGVNHDFWITYLDEKFLEYAAVDAVSELSRQIIKINIWGEYGQVWESLFMLSTFWQVSWR